MTTPTEQAEIQRLHGRIKVLVKWIELNDPEAFSQGLWDKLNEADATTPPAAPTRHDGSISFEEAQELARKHAKAEPESYYSEPFEPHLWVINAVVEASATWYQRAVDERIRRVKAEARATLASTGAAASPVSELCRDDGRCQYAIDHGAEGMGHCPEGKCAIPKADVRIYWHAHEGWKVEWLTEAPNGGQTNYYRAASTGGESK